ncbi:hypothetical protein ABZS78_15375, partial [Streptomyces decoyicus]
ATDDGTVHTVRVDAVSGKAGPPHTESDDPDYVPRCRPSVAGAPRGAAPFVPSGLTRARPPRPDGQYGVRLVRTVSTASASSGRSVRRAGQDFHLAGVE